MFGVLPAQQRFERADSIIHQIDHRLKRQAKLALEQGVASLLAITGRARRNGNSRGKSPLRHQFLGRRLSSAPASDRPRLPSFRGLCVMPGLS
jgi:hypothetical protein